MNRTKELVAVVIPIYTETVTPLEQISLKFCFAYLKKYPVYFICPRSLSVNAYTSCCGGEPNFQFFDDHFFNGIEGYNRLMLSNEFYERFKLFNYVLIHQLDAIVFGDQLENWCKRGYDYIAAPWINPEWHKDYLGAIRNWNANTPRYIQHLVKTLNRWRFNRQNALMVGNGGLSLRRVSSFNRLLTKYGSELRTWPYNEDIFWSMFVPLNEYSFRIPSFAESLTFSFDAAPDYCLKVSRNVLPFGAHAWFRQDKPYKGNRDFWYPIIESRLNSLSGREHQINHS